MHASVTTPNRFVQCRGTTRRRAGGLDVADTTAEERQVPDAGRASRSLTEAGGGSRAGRPSLDQRAWGTPPDTNASRGSCTEASETMSRPNTTAVEPHGEHADLALPGRDGQHVVAAVHQPGEPALDDQVRRYWKMPRPRPERRDDAEAVVQVVAAAARRAASATRFAARRLPCRTACCAFGTVSAPGRGTARSGTAASSPAAHASGTGLAAGADPQVGPHDDAGRARRPAGRCACATTGLRRVARRPDDQARSRTPRRSRARRARRPPRSPGRSGARARPGARSVSHDPAARARR